MNVVNTIATNQNKVWDQENLSIVSIGQRPGSFVLVGHPGSNLDCPDDPATVIHYKIINQVDLNNPDMKLATTLRQGFGAGASWLQSILSELEPELVKGRSRYIFVTAETVQTPAGSKTLLWGTSCIKGHTEKLKGGKRDRGGSSSSSIFDPDQCVIEQTRRFGYRNRLIIHHLPHIINLKDSIDKTNFLPLLEPVYPLYKL